MNDHSYRLLTSGQGLVGLECHLRNPTHGAETSETCIKQLDEAFQLQAAKPQAGKNCDDIKTGYRKFPQGGHVIFYHDGADCVVEIIRILHESMDVDSAMIGG